MMLRATAVIRAYMDVVEAGGESPCLPWRNFVNRAASYRDFLSTPAPAVHFVPSVNFELESCILVFYFLYDLNLLCVFSCEEADPEDHPYADRVLRYVDLDGEHVEFYVSMAPPSKRMVVNALPEHYAVAPRKRVHRWMVVIDSLKKHCVKMTRKLVGRDRASAEWTVESEDRAPQTGVSAEQTGRDLGLDPSSSAKTFRRRSYVDPKDVPSSSA
ncbi:uncharacterized protein [Spinacia oleracea]|uniref:Uncharacterized protein isoform X1 n=1 Tax=Spinacia oleracea TaxID=3562 RepID=A0ABM3QNC0_SPIOL|nr:uncharacterized protein LOC130461015 isoform X1 [Spinacia oleracea]